MALHTTVRDNTACTYEICLPVGFVAAMLALEAQVQCPRGKAAGVLVQPCVGFVKNVW